jgi:uncharacterized delta-60 repeat protein
MKKFILFLLFIVSCWMGQAQVNQLDLNFNPTDKGYASGNGFDGKVNKVVTQQDGKVLVGGNFSMYNGVFKNHFIRLNPDGSVDKDFGNGVGVDNEVAAIALQPDGKIVIAGSFNHYDGTPRNQLTRLNRNGYLDPTFDPGLGVNTSISSMVIQPNGKIIVSGPFTSYNGVPRQGIARINTDGSLDMSFNVNLGIEGQANTMALQPDGKIIIGGFFYNFDQGIYKHTIRLNSDGSVDKSFNPKSYIGEIYATDYTASIAVQPDGKILIGGIFDIFDDWINNLVRLNSDGSLDESFVKMASNSYGSLVTTILLQPDGRILIGGSFTEYAGVSGNRLVSLNSNGELDSTFKFDVGADNDVNTVSLNADGSIFIGGIFESYDQHPARKIARLHRDGYLDQSFNPSTGANSSVLTTVVQPDGRVLIGGAFTTYNGSNRKYIARLNSDGTLDATFNPGNGPDSHITSIVTQPDGKILIGGFFNNYNGDPKKYIARLNSDGSLDRSFTPATNHLNGNVYAIAIQPDGGILLAGNLKMGHGYPYKNYIIRLNSDGSYDESFDPGIGMDGSIHSIIVQPDGKIVIGGSFTSYNGTNINLVARLNSNGSLDQSFNPGTKDFSGIVRAINHQANGKILIAGALYYNGGFRSTIIRLRSDGSNDEDFDSGNGVDGEVYSMVMQPDEKLVISGYFTSYNGTNRNNMARLNNNGSIDTSFDPESGANDTIYSMALQPDGKLLIGGGFTAYNNIGRNRIARTLSTNTITKKQTAVNHDQITLPPAVEKMSKKTKLINIYPVPTSHTLIIKNVAGNQLFLNIMNIGGKSVYKGNISSSQLSINVQGWASGIYKVIVSDDKQQLNSTEQFLKL